MHVVALNQFYAPDRSATAQLLTELAEGLVARGHRVTVVTSGPRFARTFQGESQQRKERNGVTVIRIPSTHLGKGNIVRRAADYTTFYLQALRTLATLDTPADVFLPLTTPPFVALAAQLAALPRPSYRLGLSLARRTPVVALVQDLYPDVAVRLGVIAHGGLAHRAFGALSGASLRAATHLVVLSEGMAEHVRRYGVRPGLIDVIPNWALAEVEQSEPSHGLAARLEYGLGERFVVMYSGNLGAAHQFETLLAAARRLRHRGDIVFAFVGGGVRRAEVERFVAREALPNVRLFPLAPLSQLGESLGAGDLHVVTMRDGVEGLLVPSKLYGILAAARPTLFIGPSGDSVARTIVAADAGVVHDNGDVSGVVATIERLAARRDDGRAMGQRGRAYLHSHLSRARALDAYERVLSRAVSAASPTSPATGSLQSDARDRRVGR